MAGRGRRGILRRPSVYLEVKRRPPGSGTNHDVATSYDYCTDPLLQELKEKEELFPRTIVYLPLNWCGHTHKRALGVLSESSNHMAVQPPEEKQLKSFVAQFHAPQTTQMKTLISSTMLQPHSQLRLLLATEAYGMGADCPDVRRVIHVSPPKNLETYAQEIGRCARDGAPGRATLYYNNGDVAVPGKKKMKGQSNEASVAYTEGDESDESTDSDASDTSAESDNDQSLVNDKGAEKKSDRLDRNRMTAAMRKFCMNTTVCRRELLMEYFGFSVLRTDADECCDVCSGTVERDYAKGTPDPKPDPVIVDLLMDYFEFENEDETAKVANMVPELHTGLCLSLARKLASYPQRYQKGEALARDFPYLTDNNILNIQNCITYGLRD